MIKKERQIGERGETPGAAQSSDISDASKQSARFGVIGDTRKWHLATITLALVFEV
jgi:hypothetical protein